MSLYHLGIAHFPTLHRQYSSPSPTAARFARSVREEASPDPDITQDNKDVLIERLNDLVSRLSATRSLEDGVVSSIHKEVDRIEVLMRGERDLTPVENSQKCRTEDRVSWGPASPSQNVGMHFPSQWPKSPRTSQKVPKKAEISTSKTMEIATAADALVAQLTHVISELQDRKEESLHIHDLLVVRCEKAVERIIFLENRIAELEDDFEANQSELRYLKLQLRALEVQCLRYIPPNEDKELTESIQNWRVDWEDIDRQTKARRKRCHVPRPGLGHDDSWSTELSSSSSIMR